jgi:hypothetical protein
MTYKDYIFAIIGFIGSLLFSVFTILGYAIYRASVVHPSLRHPFEMQLVYLKDFLFSFIVLILYISMLILSIYKNRIKSNKYKFGIMLPYSLVGTLCFAKIIYKSCVNLINDDELLSISISDYLENVIIHIVIIHISMFIFVHFFLILYRCLYSVIMKKHYY